jgi:lysozyme
MVHDRRLSMTQDVSRILKWTFFVLLLAALVFAGCTRSKQSGPPTPTSLGTAAPGETQAPGPEATATPTESGESPISATTTAWAVQTLTAAAETSQPAEATTTSSPETTDTPEPTAQTATETPGGAATATPQATETAEATQAPGTGQATTHVVKAGENLFRIALSYGLSYQTLASYNGITNPNMIYVGQTLKIPASGDGGQGPSQPDGGSQAGVHIVQPGENLFRIALQYNMLYTALAQANGLSYPYTVYQGQRLIIP